jgi:hypothetical protein
MFGKRQSEKETAGYGEFFFDKELKGIRLLLPSEASPNEAAIT